MGKTSEISWTDATWNVATGCDKVSEECKYCYMMRDLGGRWKKDVIGNVTRTNIGTFNAPIQWQKQGMLSDDGRPFKVFTSSLTDAWHEYIDSYRHEIYSVIDQCPDLIFQMLTKRIERVEETELIKPGDMYARKNIWLGTSIGLDKHWKRVEKLCETRARIKFLSIEPMLGPIDSLDSLFRSYPGGIHWVIFGGESGNETGKWRYRPTELEWVLEAIEVCDHHEVPVFVKQLGTHLAKKLKLNDRHGRDMSEWPKMFQRQEFPKYYDDLKIETAVV